MKTVTPFAVTSTIVGSVWIICRTVLKVNAQER